ncbi:CAP domain-containing protein [Pelomonas sp. APW6]|uniref:CAP domain-containing protein n=1 Tax=Roseateles subflavus TaxID=3053353 RepID=A0ABT7LGT3_9BURK|nr:CAP domain-containing protein [Pelomonas sp. APW6]MDL5031482.1 CAP domain-containing protein [Pelomonas sp. APW6]
MVNTQRQRGAVCGTQSMPAVSAIRWSTALAQAAQRHSQDMVDRNFFDHTGSDGSNAGQRISAAGYRWSSWGENIAAGQSSAESVVQAWMNSEGHCRNIMNARYVDMGLACVRANGGTGRLTWTQDFASP